MPQRPRANLSTLASRLEQGLSQLIAVVSRDPGALRPWIVEGYGLPARTLAAPCGARPSSTVSTSLAAVAGAGVSPMWGRPAAILLVGFGRLDHRRAALQGRLAVWGRRPWLAPAFPRLLHTP